MIIPSQVDIPPSSCSPNAYLAFDYARFSATLCALRDIKNGEEITITYIPDLTLDATKCQTALGHFGFVCNCASCTNPSSEDLKRVIVQSVCPPSQSVTLADHEKVLRESIKWIRAIEKEGLQVLPEYEAHLTAAATASLVLGNSKDHAKYTAIVDAWRRVVWGVPQQGLFRQSLFRVYEP